MQDSAIQKEVLPNLTRKDVGLILMSEWKTDGKSEQRKAVDAAMQVWDHFPWPKGLLSYNCYLGNNGQSILHYSQWEDEESQGEFVKNDPPERMQEIMKSVSIERQGLDKYHLYRSIVSDSAAIPGCIVMVREEFEKAELTTQFIDTVCQALADDPQKCTGGMAAYFHVNLEGTVMMNYAEWTNEQAHQDCLDRSAKYPKEISPLWQKVWQFPGRLPKGQVKRFRFYRSISKS